MPSFVVGITVGTHLYYLLVILVDCACAALLLHKVVKLNFVYLPFFLLTAHELTSYLSG